MAHLPNLKGLVLPIPPAESETVMSAAVETLGTIAFSGRSLDLLRQALGDVAEESSDDDAQPIRDAR